MTSESKYAVFIQSIDMIEEDNVYEIGFTERLWIEEEKVYDYYTSSLEITVQPPRVNAPKYDIHSYSTRFDFGLMDVCDPEYIFKYESDTVSDIAHGQLEFLKAVKL